MKPSVPSQGLNASFSSPFSKGSSAGIETGDGPDSRPIERTSAPAAMDRQAYKAKKRTDFGPSAPSIPKGKMHTKDTV